MNAKASAALDEIFAATSKEEDRMRQGGPFFTGEQYDEIADGARQGILDRLQAFDVTPTDEVLIGMVVLLDIIEHQAESPASMLPFGFVVEPLKRAHLSLMARLRAERIG